MRLKTALKFAWTAAALVPQAGSGQADTVPVPAAVQTARLNGTRTVSGAPGPRYWQFYPEYGLAARLLPESALLRGSGFISARNVSPDVLTEVVLRLDQNRFRVPSRDWSPTAGMTVQQLLVGGQPIDLLGPGLLDSTGTVLRVPVPEPIAPGGLLRITLTWEYEVLDGEESPSMRQGRWGDRLFQMGQWYPRLAMYDDLGGWDDAPHEGSMEFYNPIGSFAVSLALPPGWLVGATGELENAEVVFPISVRERLELAERSDTLVTIVDAEAAGPRTLDPGNGTLIWEFRADSVRDFAWAASPDYSSAVLSSARVQERRVPIHAFTTERHREELFASTEVVAEAIGVLSERLTPYPWPLLTLVDGPEGGMEYPALTMSHGDREPHETNHQWFPMIVGSDETRFSFIDEGLASFLGAVVEGRSLGWDGAERPTMSPLLLGDDVRTVRPVMGYGRGARVFGHLALRFGDEAVVEALRVFSTEWRFKHPSPWDLMASVERTLGAELDSVWLAWLFDAGPVR